MTFLLAVLVTLSIGHTRVDNPIQPTSKKKLVFEADLSLGAESGEDEQLWTGQVTSVVVGRDGSIFIVDSGSERILKFSADGEYIRTYGGPGQGPGEFHSLQRLTFMEDGSAVVFTGSDNGQMIHYFDKNMEFVRRERPKGGKFYMMMAHHPNGRFIAFNGNDGNSVPNAKTYSGIMGVDGETKLMLSSKLRPIFNNQRAGDPTHWRDLLANWLKLIASGAVITAYGPDGVMYTANTNAYEISVYDTNLNKTRVISRKYKPIPQSEEQIASYGEAIREVVLRAVPPELKSMVTPKMVGDAVEMAEFAPIKQPIFGLLPVDDGKLLVIHDYDSISGESSADIFDENGVFIGQCELPAIPVNILVGYFGGSNRMPMVKNRAYAMEVDEDGEWNMVRYKMNWK